ncbi:unnamed protein product [Pseudo-nitzschia multistriata]|uniref:Uncharacterized protein n=1 Tax=Pseudo-nitzschia multistriata TaxID=183589 RepID=A0A448Z3T8_9STRA|nr:unnamed protein product [Pseudo-nitzschia multistriata]
MAEQFFQKVADDVDAAAEQLWSIFGAGSAEQEDKADATGGPGADSGSFAHQFDFSDTDIDGLSDEEIQRLLGEEMMRNNPLQDIANDVTQNIVAGQAQPQSAREHFDAFRSAINWSEKFVIGLVCFQIVMFLLCLYFSKKDRGLAPRISLLVFIGIVVRAAEWLNSIGADHWESFATQDYFDKKGIFVGIMLCAPLLLDSLMMLLFFMKEASTLLVQVKRNEIKQKQKKKSKSDDGKKEKVGGRTKTKKQD